MIFSHPLLRDDLAFIRLSITDILQNVLKMYTARSGTYWAKSLNSSNAELQSRISENMMLGLLKRQNAI